MFPTPAFAYFTGQLNRDGCKPHLLALGRDLFPSAPSPKGEAKGGTFTRFMIAGFATYRALSALGAESFEGYPDLQFRLWNASRALPSKSGGRSIALARRREIVAEVAKLNDCTGHERIHSLDEADATILALSGIVTAAHGTHVIVEHRAEGRLLVAFQAGTTVAFDA